MNKKLDTNVVQARLIFVIIFALVCFSVLIFRLWFLQVIRGSFYWEESENNRIRTIKIIAPRGNILDRNGFLFVKNRPSYNVALLEEDIVDLPAVIKKIAEITGIEEEKLNTQLKQEENKRHFEPKIILPDVPRELLAKIKAHSHSLPGVIVTYRPTRDYPHKDFASHLFGYAREITKEQLIAESAKDYHQGDIVGQAGIEKTFDKKLRGEDGIERIVVDARGNRKGESGIIDAEPGHDLYLTIDADLQMTAEKALEGKRGAVVALDPNNGQVLVLASVPSVDANTFAGQIDPKIWSKISQDPAKPLLNRAISQRYAPGSTVKLMMSAIGLQEGKITDEKEINCPGFFHFSGRPYHCHKRSGHGPVNLKKAITVSCNTYFFLLGSQLGIDTINRYGSMFGLGQTSGIDLPGEDIGTLPSDKWKRQNHQDKWYPGDTLPVAIGQGYLTVTPIQMAQVIAAIANNGKIYKPQLVKQVHDPVSGEIQETLPKLVKEVSIDSEIFQTVRNYAGEVVNSKTGTGNRAAIEGITVGGKTGTAQVGALGTEHLGELFKDHAWFISFAPLENPQIAVAVIVENSGHGGTAAAPISKKIMEVFFKKKGMIQFTSEELELQKAEAQKTDSQKADPQKTELPKTEAQKIEATKSIQKNTDSKKTDNQNPTKKPDSKKNSKASQDDAPFEIDNTSGDSSGFEDDSEETEDERYSD